ncbi:MAG: response regulator transcription factor [Verrucomicrobiota bacterium]|jgi:DNA-binding NarL/FixJ family response regulator
MGTGNHKARVLVVDDHPIVREGIAGLIDRQPDLACCGKAGTIAQAQTALETKAIDLLLLDLRIGQGDGLETIKSFKGRFPSLPILVISQFDENTYAERALRAGARGYVMKEQATEELLGAIRQVLSGQLYFSPSFGRRAVERILNARPATRDSDLGALSDRELHVFKCVGAGKTNKQIAAELHLSVKTIETYREHLKWKLRLAGAAELAQRASDWLRDQPGG